MIIRSFLVLVASLTSAVAADSPPVVPASGAPTRWINPLPLPNYPVGRIAREVAKGARDPGGLWLVDHAEQYRELADPTILWHEGKWYLYPSVDMAWVSADEGRTWEHHPLNVRDIGYAPTVVHHRGRFLLMASDSAIYAGPTPLGPFEPIGKLAMPALSGLPSQIDPMLFSDEDGRLFYYWGCTPNSGIWGVELDAADPTHVIGKPQEMIPFLPDTYPWERVGSNNQNPNTGWMEGAWMLKHGGKYYLTYSSGGTQYPTYSMGCYVSDSPLGPFVPQKRNPIFRSTAGLITGTAHGSIVHGPRGRLWTVYTVFACVVHGFERRVGLDLAEIDANGELFVPRATSTPQPLPGDASAAAWLPLNQLEPTHGSTNAPNTTGRLAVDDNLTTTWIPASDDATPMLTSNFSARATIHAARVVWRDVGLDTPAGNRPGPFRYRIEVETAPGVWTTIVDRSKSDEDFLIDYRECAPTSALRARLVIVGHPKGIEPGVAEFTLFGITDRR
jgi:xylan 1,4-beta-xylosidase